jgi:hypothetical protein
MTAAFSRELTGMDVTFDVTSLHHRRAVHRWERTSVGDLLERLTWSFPDKEALIGRPGAYGDPAFAQLTSRQADELASQVANGLLAPDMVAAMTSLVRPRVAIVDAELWPRAEAPFTAAGLTAAITIEIGGGPVPGSVSFRAGPRRGPGADHQPAGPAPRSGASRRRRAGMAAARRPAAGSYFGLITGGAGFRTIRACAPFSGRCGLSHACRVSRCGCGGTGCWWPCSSRPPSWKARCGRG